MSNVRKLNFNQTTEQTVSKMDNLLHPDTADHPWRLPCAQSSQETKSLIPTYKLNGLLVIFVTKIIISICIIDTLCTSFTTIFYCYLSSTQPGVGWLYSYRYMTCVVQSLRLAISKEPNRVGVSLPHLGMETDPASETMCFLVFRIPCNGQSPETQ
jgi:hypothetical protein